MTTDCLCLDELEQSTNKQKHSTRNATQASKWKKNTNTHHFWINCGNKGATSCGQTKPRRPIVMAKNTFIDKEKKQIHAVRNRKHKTKQNKTPT